MPIPTTRASATAPPSPTTSPAEHRCGSSPARSARRARSSGTAGPNSPSIAPTNWAATASASSPRPYRHWASARPSISAAPAAGVTRAWSAPRTRRRQRFVDADDREAVGALVAIIRQLRPHVVVTYDPNGGYGHPDHIQTHDVTTAAVAAAGTAIDYPGQPWQVPKFYWTVLAESAFEAGWNALDRDDLLPEWVKPPPDGDSTSDTPTTRSTPSSRPTRGARRQDGGACRARHPGGGRPDRSGLRAVEQHGAADRRRRSTTFWSPARPGIAMSVAGRPICSRDSI